MTLTVVKVVRWVITMNTEKEKYSLVNIKKREELLSKIIYSNRNSSVTGLIQWMKSPGVFFLGKFFFS